VAVVDAFSYCNGSSAFFPWIAIDSIQVVILNMKPLMCVCIESHGYMQILQLFAELIILPQNAIRIKYYDFEGPMNSICHYPLLI
jgi:hypothetical protein